MGRGEDGRGGVGVGVGVRFSPHVTLIKIIRHISNSNSFLRSLFYILQAILGAEAGRKFIEVVMSTFPHIQHVMIHSDSSATVSGWNMAELPSTSGSNTNIWSSMREVAGMISDINCQDDGHLVMFANGFEGLRSAVSQPLIGPATIERCKGELLRLYERYLSCPSRPGKSAGKSVLESELSDDSDLEVLSPRPILKFPSVFVS